MAAPCGAKARRGNAGRSEGKAEQGHGVDGTCLAKAKQLPATSALQRKGEARRGNGNARQSGARRSWVWQRRGEAWRGEAMERNGEAQRRRDKIILAKGERKHDQGSQGDNREKRKQGQKKTVIFMTAEEVIDAMKDKLLIGAFPHPDCIVEYDVQCAFCPRNFEEMRLEQTVKFTRRKRF